MQNTPEPNFAGDQHLLLVDGYNLVRRVYGANPAPDGPEKAKATVRASLGSFRRALSEHKPTHALAVFDHGGPNWRHELYPAYHANRKPMPEDLRAAMPTLFEQLRGLGLVTLAVPGVEADDVLACVSRRWDLRRGPVTVLSTDKDMTWLVAHGVRVYDHFENELRDQAWIENKYGVKPELMLDWLALMGDSTDNVPGVPDVGPKTAAKWLAAHGDLEGVLAAAAAMKGKTGEKLRSSVELVRLARKLVSFKTDLTLGLTWNTLRLAA